MYETATTTETIKPTPSGRRRWLWPIATAVALLLGIGIGAAIGTETEPVTETVEVPGETPQSELDDLAAQQDAVAEHEAALDEREAALDDREAALDDREAGLTQAEEKQAANTIPGDGVFEVGVDIQPGTYKSAGPVDTDWGGYWARLSGTSGEFDDIIANGNPTGPVTVTIADSDVAFETTGMKEWVK